MHVHRAIAAGFRLARSAFRKRTLGLAQGLLELVGILGQERLAQAIEERVAAQGGRRAKGLGHGRISDGTNGAAPRRLRESKMVRYDRTLQGAARSRLGVFGIIAERHAPDAFADRFDSGFVRDQQVGDHAIVVGRLTRAGIQHHPARKIVPVLRRHVILGMIATRGILIARRQIDDRLAVQARQEHGIEQFRGAARHADQTIAPRLQRQFGPGVEHFANARDRNVRAEQEALGRQGLLQAHVSRHMNGQALRIIERARHRPCQSGLRNFHLPRQPVRAPFVERETGSPSTGSVFRVRDHGLAIAATVRQRASMSGQVIEGRRFFP